MSRNTVQKTLVLQALVRLHNHPTADMVWAEVRSRHPAISRGTVYRNLNRLAREGKIAAMKIPGGAGRFDHRTAPHCHTKCTACGQVSDLDRGVISGLSERIKEAAGFEIAGEDIVFEGLCRQCRAKSREAKND